MNFSPQTTAWMTSHSQKLCHRQTRRPRTEDTDAEGKILSEREREDAEQISEPPPLVSVHHLLFLQHSLGFDGQDQIRGGVPQLAHVLIDVAVPLQPNVIVHVPGLNILLEVAAARGKAVLLKMLCDVCIRL